jgi:hypothetical protein
MRSKSGGRAATFFVDGSYAFDSAGFLKADLIDVKGVGVHKDSDFAADPTRTVIVPPLFLCLFPPALFTSMKFMAHSAFVDQLN